MEFDALTESKLNTVIPEIAAAWRCVAQDMWDHRQLKMRITQGLRTFAQQWDCWHQGRLKDKNGTWVICDVKKVVTFAMPGQSYHQYGLALDACFVGEDPYLSQMKSEDSDVIWREYGQFCYNHKLAWGGYFKHPDRPHCEMTFGLSVHELQILYEEHGLKGVFNKCKNISNCGKELV